MKSVQITQGLGVIVLIAVLLATGIRGVIREANGAEPQIGAIREAPDEVIESVDLRLGPGDLDVYDVAPCDGGNDKIDVDDLLAMLDAFAGVYACSCPAGAGLWDENGFDIYNTNIGFIGIGTPSPTTQLMLRSADSETTLNADSGSPNTTMRFHNHDLTIGNFSSIAFSSVATNAVHYEAAKIAAVNTSHLNGAMEGDLAFLTRVGTDFDERMRIEADGDVGIGTTNPTMALHISGANTSTSLTAFGGSPDCGLRIHNNDLTNNNFSSIAFTSLASNNAQFEAAKIAAVNVEHTIGSTAGDLAFLTRGTGGFTEKMRIVSSGNVGIGTNNPGTHKLQVTGDATELVQFNGTTALAAGDDLLALEALSGSAASAQYIECFAADVDFRVDLDGDVLADGTFSGPADFAEMIRVTDGVNSVEPGDVMVIDSRNPRAVVKSTAPRSTLVAGIYSTKPGFLGSPHDWDDVARQVHGAQAGAADGFDNEGPTGDPIELGRMIGEVPLAIMGIVPCKVSAENGPIRAGDLLVTSSTYGHAMREENPRTGTVIGKALDSLESGTGVISVLVALH